MDVDYSVKEKAVGVFIIAVVLLVLGVVVVVGRGKNWFETYVTYYTAFEESYNLQVNAAVKLYKADIGKVTEITPLEDRVRVRLAILEPYASRFRQDTVVTVESPTFIGSEYVSVTPGGAESPAVPEGGEIRSEPKRLVSDILAEFEVEKTAKMFVNAVQDLSEVAHALKSPQGPLFEALGTFNMILVHIEEIIRDVNAGEGTVGGILKSKALLEVIERNFSQLNVILDDISRASARAPGAMDQVQANLDVIHKIGTDVDAAALSVNALLKRIDENLNSLKVILSNLESGSYDVPEITRTTREGIQEIRAGVENVDRVFKSLQQNILIKPGLPPEPVGETIDPGLRE